MAGASAGATANATASTMLPPPKGVFSTREQLLISVLEHALSQGYATSIPTFKKNKYVYIHDTTGYMTYLMFAYPTSIELST